VTIEAGAGLVLSLIGLLVLVLGYTAGVAFRLGALSREVDGLTKAQAKNELDNAATVTKLANLHSDVRLIVSRVNDIRHAQEKGKVYMLDQREDS
jgi:hypothetical protein